MKSSQRLTREFKRRRRHGSNHARHLGFIAWLESRSEFVRDQWRHVIFEVLEAGLRELDTNSRSDRLSISELCELLSSTMDHDGWRLPVVQIIVIQVAATPNMDNDHIIELNRTLLSLNYCEDPNYWRELGDRTNDPTINAQVFAGLMLYRPRDAFEWLLQRPLTPNIRRVLPITLEDAHSVVGRVELTNAVAWYVSNAKAEDVTTVSEIAEALGMDIHYGTVFAPENTIERVIEDAVLAFVSDIEITMPNLRSQIGTTLGARSIINDCFVANFSRISLNSNIVTNRWLLIAREYPSDQIVMSMLIRTTELLNSEEGREDEIRAIIDSLVTLSAPIQILASPTSELHTAFARRVIAMARVAVVKVPGIEESLPELIKLFVFASDDLTAQILVEIGLESDLITLDTLWGKLAHSLSRTTINPYFRRALDQILSTPIRALAMSPGRREELRLFFTNEELEDGGRILVLLHEAKHSDGSPAISIIESLEQVS